jgi:hypothetical protein
VPTAPKNHPLSTISQPPKTPKILKSRLPNFINIQKMPTAKFQNRQNLSGSVFSYFFPIFFLFFCNFFLRLLSKIAKMEFKKRRNEWRKKREEFWVGRGAVHLNPRQSSPILLLIVCGRSAMQADH